MDNSSFFMFNIFLNSFLAFWTVTFLVEAILFLFRIPEGRMRALLRMIPIFKLPLDLYLYNFSQWAYMQGINPWNSEEGTRTLHVKVSFMSSGIQFTLPGGKTFTVADSIGYLIPPLILHTFVGLFILVTLALVLRRLFFYRRSFKSLTVLAEKAQPLNRQVRNRKLFSSMKRYAVQVLTSPALRDSPFVAGGTSSNIYLSSSLSEQLSKREFEAILAHEMEHVRCKDGLVRFILEGIATIFWWIPTRGLSRRIKESQEIGCDLQCTRYGIEGASLASAIYKSAKYSLNSSNVFTHHFTQQRSLKRVELLLKPPVRLKKIDFVRCMLASAIAFLVIFLGRFWLF